MAEDTDQMKAELEKLRQENADLKRKAVRGTSIRISPKGGLSVYGLGRFPVTLYKEQWLRLMDMDKEIREFIRSHDSELKAKQEAAPKE